MKKIIRDINLTFVYPPIPDRNFDWQATRSGYDEGEPIGRGRTPVVALADLLDREMELEDEEPEVDPRWDEDQYLDDPRHGQARDLNRGR